MNNSPIARLLIVDDEMPQVTALCRTLQGKATRRRVSIRRQGR